MPANHDDDDLRVSQPPSQYVFLRRTDLRLDCAYSQVDQGLKEHH